MENRRFMRIINAVDFYGEKFVPIYPFYEVIYTHEKFVAIGVDGHVIYKMKWEDVEDYNI